jgi:Ca-activated chloride channel family protein
MRFALWFTLALQALWLAFASSAHGQGGFVTPVERTPWTPARLVLTRPAETPVRLESVRVRTEVTGGLAQTEVEMVFRNPNARILEGELQFPLLDGQSVTGFAMDVNGKMRDAVPVDKARGQAVFEEVIRGKIDPGLLEVTQGNNFKLRVYPIPANGTKQVVIRYAEALSGSNQRLRYRLPLEYAERLDHFQLDVRVGGAQSAPVVDAGSLGAFPFASQGAYFTAQVTRAQFAGRGLLELEIARLQSAQVTTQAFDGRNWFYAEIPVAVREAARKVARRIAIVWDSSGSGATRDHDREFALLDAYFRRMGNGEVRLQRVRNAAEPAQTFRVVNGDWRELRTALANTAYDGATDLGAVTPERGVEEVLLFTDGLANFGARPFPEIPVPVHTLSAATRADHTWLKHIAHRSGGRFVDLTADATPEALRKLTTATTRVTAVTADGASQLVLGSPYPERGRIAVAGQLLQAAAKLALTVEHPGAPPTTVHVAVDPKGNEGRLAAFLWARLRVAALEAEYDLNRTEIRRTGRTFGLVTRETSLIVLDRIEDYARYEITPPAELLADYERIRATVARQRDNDRSRHLAEVIRRFEEKANWWNREFPKDERPAPKKAEQNVGGALSDTLRREDNLAQRRAAESERSGEVQKSLSSERRRVEAPVAAQAPQPAPGVRPAAPAPAVATRDAAGPGGNQPQTQATIRLAPWQPNAPWAERMRNADAANAYRVYLDERPGQLASTAFFLDAADVLIAKNQKELAVRVLSNLAEMDLENRHILRILGYRLLQAGDSAAALPVFRKVLELSPEEPQSYRDLGLALAADGQLQKAIDTLYEVVVRPWHNRFPEIELITLAELNAIVATAGTKLDTSRIHPQLLKNLPLDLRVVLTWDADNTDIDLWVTDPNGEKAYYGNRLTYQGGRMSQDFTGGYGPEEFSLKRAKPGKYRIEAQYYGDRRQAVTGPTTLQVRLATKFGTAEQADRMITLRLSGRSEIVYVGEFEVEAKNGK